ncbi:protein decapping 5-like [Cucurbita pepo subsp. pepo]|uniref:protein decapping 5-like n=1 Tax=Cucurbita pepo subsp. pepo TaxID=3664 RepID=UPI000C9D388F|nr:protein decapping 5-like [Cucurbita pepo subsp. pepo]
MASESDSRSSSAADSYVGSLISLTSKSEIRYEGVLYNINTEESSIGLRNVRSFGTEGRKKDGPQVPPSDQVFEYILFRGSDIKDLQVKSSPPVQTTSLINNDPAIIQSHYPRPVSIPSSLPPPVSGPLPDINSQAMPMGIPGSNFQSGLPLYQPGGNVGSWGASPSQPPPNPSAGGLGLPMYWQGYYGHPNGLPHMHHQSLLRPPPGLSLPSSLQQPLQYPNLNAYLPTGAPNPLEVSSSLFSANPTAPSLSSTAMPPVTVSSTLPSVLSVPQTSEMSSSSMVNKTINSALPQAPISTNLTSLSPLTASLDVSPVVPPTTNKTTTVSGSAMSYQTVSQSTSSIIGTSNSVLTSAPAPALVTPDQLLHTTVVSSSLPSQTVQKDLEVVQASSSLAAEQTVPVPADTQPPLLPLPTSSRVVQKPNGSTSQTRHIYRGRGRGRRFGNQHPTEKFTEDFDFMAMNEKFNKDEVWGHLGKNTKSPKYNDGDEKFSDEDDTYEEDDSESSKLGIKSVYNKDDFFDTLSSNTTNNEAQNGRRTRYFEQIKLDTETFGEFARYRGGRGGFGSGRGGRRGGYYGRGYGHGGRGRGRGMHNYNP